MYRYKVRGAGGRRSAMASASGSYSTAVCQRLPLFSWTRNFNIIAQYWMVLGIDLRVPFISIIVYSHSSLNQLVCPKLSCAVANLQRNKM